jgi:ribosome-associated protein
MTSLRDPATIDGVRSIPSQELEIRVSRAGGAGGQHVNKTSTRVEAIWRPAESGVLTEAEKARVLTMLANRLDASGAIRVVASDTRSQLQNRLHAERRLAALVRRALVIRKPRRPTRPGKGAVERRLTEKKLESRKKRDRRPVLSED